MATKKKSSSKKSSSKSSSSKKAADKKKADAKKAAQKKSSSKSKTASYYVKQANGRTAKITASSQKEANEKAASIARKEGTKVLSVSTSNTTSSTPARTLDVTPSVKTSGKVIGYYGNKPIYEDSQSGIQAQMAAIDRGGIIQDEEGVEDMPEVVEEDYEQEYGSTFLAEQLKDPKKKAQFDALPDDLKMIYAQSAKSLEKAISAGKVVNPNITITAAENRKLLTQAEQELEPYYKERLGVLRRELDTSIDRIMQDANDLVKRSEQPFQQSLEVEDEDQAQSGTTYSSEREKRERNLVLDQQYKLDDVAIDASRLATDKGRAYEKEAGTSALRELNIPSLKTYRAARGGFQENGSRSLVSPLGNIDMGEIEKDKTTEVERRRSELEDTLRRSRILDFSGLS
jgi:hypothetical protein